MTLRERARALKRELYVLYLCLRHPDTPWHCKLLALATLAYAVSPVDLIPDFIPVLGLLDDLILVPLGIYLTFRGIPPAVLAECRAEAQGLDDRERKARVKGLPLRWVGLALILLTWIAVAALLTALWSRR